MTTRIQLTKDVYMHVDGQWSIVAAGSVIDVPSSVNITQAIALAEVPGTLLSMNTVQVSTSVRNLKRI
jgi:hypothetical protein